MSSGLSGQLRWTWPLQPRQSAGSLASRLGALNGRVLHEFLRDMGISVRAMDLGLPNAVTAVAAVGGVAPAELARWTPCRLDDVGFFEIGRERLHRLSLARTYFRFCPSCVLEDIDRFDGPAAARPWMRLEWTIVHVRTCPTHGCLLLSCHPQRQRFAPVDFNSAVPKRPAELRGLEDSLPVLPHSDFQDWLIRRLEGTQEAGVWLDGLSLDVAVGLCEALGVSALHDPKVRTGAFAVEDWAAAADAGYAIAADGPKAIEELLERLVRAQRSTRGVWGARDTFGYVYGLLAKHADEDAWAVPRDLVAGFAMRSLPLEAGAVVLGHVVQRQIVHTIRSASKVSGTHTLTMRRLVDREGLAPDGVASGLMDHRVTVSADRIGETLERLSNALATSEVLRRTGFPLQYLRTALTDGHLPTVTGSDRRRNAKHRFDPDAVSGLLDRMFDGCETIQRRDDNMVGIKEARARAVTSQSRILGMIFGQELRWKGRLAGKEGFDALLLDLNEVVRRVRSEPNGFGIGMREILDRLPGLGRDAPKALVARGLLTVTEEFSPEARRMVPVITPDSAEAFRRKFVTLGELCQRTGLHHKKVRLLLRVAAIKEVFPFADFGCFVYSRALVEGAEAATPDFWAYDKKRAQEAVRHSGRSSDR